MMKMRSASIPVPPPVSWPAVMSVAEEESRDVCGRAERADDDLGRHGRRPARAIPQAPRRLRRHGLRGARREPELLGDVREIALAREAADLIFDRVRERAPRAVAAPRLVPRSAERVVLPRRPRAIEPIDDFL